MIRFSLWSVTFLMTFIVACTGGLLIWVAVDTVDSAEAAVEFLDLMVTQQTEAAYGQTSALFRAEMNEKQFTGVLDRAFLRKFSLEPWRDRNLDRSNHTKIQGTLVDGFALEIPFELDLVREGGDWRVLSIRGEGRFLSGPGAWFRVPPPDEDLRILVADIMARFDEAVKGGDLRPFYDTMSSAFKLRVTFFRFEQAHRSYIEDEIDLSGVLVLDAVWDGLATIEVEGQREIMLVKGFYPLEPLPVPFIFRYIYQHPDWKIFRIQVNKPNVSALSPEQCLTWLKRQKDQDFNRCL